MFLLLTFDRRNTEQKNFVFKPIFQSVYADPVFSSLDFVYGRFTYRPGFQGLSFPNFCLF